MDTTDPTEFIDRVVVLADTWSVLGKAEVAKAVKVLATIAVDRDNPLSEVGLAALQIMAQAYNAGK